MLQSAAWPFLGMVRNVRPNRVARASGLAQANFTDRSPRGGGRALLAICSTPPSLHAAGSGSRVWTGWPEFVVEIPQLGPHQVPNFVRSPSSLLPLLWDRFLHPCKNQGFERGVRRPGTSQLRAVVGSAARARLCPRSPAGRGLKPSLGGCGRHYCQGGGAPEVVPAWPGCGSDSGSLVRPRAFAALAGFFRHPQTELGEPAWRWFMSPTP